MKAALIRGPEKMSIETVAKPELNDNEVLIEVLACGICTTDVELYDGSMPYIKSGITKLPLIPGHEWTGRVAELGKNVNGLGIGQLVVGDVSIGCGICYNQCRGNIMYV